MGRSKTSPVCGGGVKLVLHSFTRETDGTVTDGAFPEAGLIFDSNGALYGTTSTGGRSKNVTFPRFNAAFCLFRCDIPEGGMKPLTIVVSFDVGEQVTEHGCRGSPRQKIEAALVNKARPLFAGFPEDQGEAYATILSSHPRMSSKVSAT